jgi:hypothetical protein
MLTNLKEYIAAHKVYCVLITIIFIILLALSISRYLKVSTPTTQAPKVDPEIVQTYTVDSTLTAKSKDTSSDPDVILKQTYIAEINGKRVEVPVVNAKAEEDSQGTIMQEVNIQPVVDLAIKDAKESVKKNWEAGAGVYVHASEVLPMVSIQRNYSTTHAVEVQLAGDREGLKGGSLAWKVKF